MESAADRKSQMNPGEHGDPDDPYKFGDKGQSDIGGGCNAVAGLLVMLATLPLCVFKRRLGWCVVFVCVKRM